jgi:protein-S-isoprenylcysteine O-methyltransferase Ste14
MATPRYLALLVPVAAVVLAAVVRRTDRRTRAAALFAFVAAGVGIAALNAAAGWAGWWTYAPAAGAFQGVPVDLWIGWAVLWGALPVLLPTPLVPTLAGLALLDAIAMPRLAAVVALGPHWLTGEAVGLGAVALPAILLGRWMAERRHLRARATLQFVVFGALTAWLLPCVGMAAGDGSWRHLTELPTWALSLWVQLAGLVALPGVLAVREFAERGGGTPYPWDPPTRLVTTGPYAYVANPMQLSATGLPLIVAAATHSWSVAAGVVSAIAFAAAVAGPHEDEDLTRRHGAAWSAYRRGVRSWWPRWHPVPMAARAGATIYVADSCNVCSSTAAMLVRLRPRDLVLRPGEWHVRRLRRARYEGPDGYHADGVAAVARTLEHVNLGWAVIGWCLRIPGLDRLTQLVADRLGAGPRDIPYRRAHGGDALQAPRGRHADHS